MLPPSLCPVPPACLPAEPVIGGTAGAPTTGPPGMVKWGEVSSSYPTLRPATPPSVTPTHMAQLAATRWGGLRRLWVVAGFCTLLWCRPGAAPGPCTISGRQPLLLCQRSRPSSWPANMHASILPQARPLPTTHSVGGRCRRNRRRPCRRPRSRPCSTTRCWGACSPAPATTTQSAATRAAGAGSCSSLSRRSWAAPSGWVWWVTWDPPPTRPPR